MPTLINAESPLRPEDAVHDEILRAGEGWMHPIEAGRHFRILELEGKQAVDTLFYNAAKEGSLVTTGQTLLWLE